MRAAAADQLWKFFEVHASQRMSHFRFFIVMVSVFFAGIGVLSKENTYLLLTLLSAFFLVTTFVFQSLDNRTRELLRLSEAHLVEYQSYLSGALDSKSVKIIEESNRSRTLSYTKSFRIMYAAAYIVGIFLFVFYGHNLWLSL